MKNKIQILYIAGYGHSGTTILEMLLGSADGVTGLGALAKIGWMRRESVRDRTKKTDPCKSIYDRIEFHLQNINASYASFVKVNGCEHLLRRKSKVECDDYKKLWKTYFSAAAEALNHSHPIFVDSSKSAMGQAKRPLLLQEIDGVDILCVHIVRKPGLILQRMKLSIKAGKLGNRRFILPQMMISSVNWLFANIWPAMYLSKKCKKYVRISYEELCEEPEATLQKIERTTGICMKKPIQYVSNHDVLPHTCAFAGNRLRHQKEIRFNPSTKEIQKFGIEKFFAILLHPFYKLLTR